MPDSVCENLSDFWFKVDQMELVCLVEADHCNVWTDGVSIIRWDEEHCASATLKI
jgi:hypothetical protein